MRRDAASQVALCFVQILVSAAAYKYTHCVVMLHSCYFIGLESDAN